MKFRNTGAVFAAFQSIKTIRAITAFFTLAVVGCLIPQKPLPPETGNSSVSLSISGLSIYTADGREASPYEPLSPPDSLIYLRGQVSAQDYTTDSVLSIPSVVVRIYAGGTLYFNSPVAIIKNSLDTPFRVLPGLNKFEVAATEPVSGATDTAVFYFQFIPNAETIRFTLMWQDSTVPLDLDLLVFGAGNLDSVTALRAHPVWEYSGQYEYAFHYGDSRGGYSSEEEAKIVNPVETAYTIVVRRVSALAGTSSRISGLTVTAERNGVLLSRKTYLENSIVTGDTAFYVGKTNLPLVPLPVDTLSKLTVLSFYAAYGSDQTRAVDYEPFTDVSILNLYAAIDYYRISDYAKRSLGKGILRTFDAANLLIAQKSYSLSKNSFFTSLDTLIPGFNTLRFCVSDSAAYPDSGEIHLAYFPNAYELEIAAVWSDLDDDADLELFTVSADSLLPSSTPPYKILGSQYLFHGGDNVVRYSSAEKIRIMNPSDAAFAIRVVNFEDHQNSSITIDSLSVRFYGPARTLIAFKDTVNIIIPSKQNLTKTLIQNINYVW